MIFLHHLSRQAALRDPLYLLPLALAGITTAVILGAQSFVGLFSDREQSFQQYRSISRGTLR